MLFVTVSFLPFVLFAVFIRTIKIGAVMRRLLETTTDKGSAFSGKSKAEEMVKTAYRNHPSQQRRSPFHFHTALDTLWPWG